MTLKKNAVIIVLLFLLSGCSSFNCTRLENFLGGETNLIKFSYKIADNLIEKALPPLMPRSPNMPILVTTFVDNNNLDQTSRFGRILQEHISSRLTQRGYTVKEIKLANTMTIEQQSGETILSRDLSKLHGTQEAQAILIGTLSRAKRTLYISTRLVNPDNNVVLSSDDYKLCIDDRILETLGLQYLGNGTSNIKEPSQPLLNSVL